MSDPQTKQENMVELYYRKPNDGVIHLYQCNDPVKIHIQTGDYNFTIKMTPDGLVLTSRWGTLEILPRGANMVIVREQPV